MNHLRIYCNLIRKAESRTPPEGYTEKHHTFPKSIFGNNNRIVVLSAREHYIAHALLEKIYLKRCGLTHWKTIKMNMAHISMKSDSKKYFNSRLYESARYRMSLMNSGKLNAFYGRKHTEKTKMLMSIKAKGRVMSEENVIKMSERNSGNKNPFYGKKHNNETKKLMSDIKLGNSNAKGHKKTKEQIEKQRSKMIGRKLSMKHREKIRNQIKGRKWWNNGQSSKMSVECPGDGWVQGRIFKGV